MTSNMRILLITVLFLSFGLVMKVSSQGELRVIKHVQQEAIDLLEVKAPSDIQEMIIEVFDTQEEMTHYFVLNNPVKRRQDRVKLNSFYLTKQMADFSKMNKIDIYPQNNQRQSFKLSEMEVNTIVKPEMEINTMNASVASMEKANLGSGEDTLKIMSYNIHHGKSLTGRYTLEEIKNIIEESGAEIIGLQEVDNNMPRSRMSNQMKYLGDALGMYYAYGDNLNILGGRYGNGVLSKYPIEYSENILLPSGREQRGLLNTVINVEGRRINFLVTHLGLNREEREKQLRVVQNYMETLSNDAFLVGDFNTTDYEELRRVKKKNVDLALTMGYGNEPTFDFPFLSKRIDYIFIPPSYEPLVYEVIKSRASDHYPITGKVAFPKN